MNHQCDFNHAEVEYNVDQCPVCAALYERDYYKEEIEYRDAVIQDLRERLGLH